jgi:hypothetical protein
MAEVKARADEGGFARCRPCRCQRVSTCAEGGCTVEELSGIESLKEAIRTIPIPGAPPPLSREAAAIGLAFLDMSLRQNHIRRLTERLTLTEHRAATSTTEVDIRLSLLDTGQREASALFQRLTSRSTGIDVESAEERPSVWVPITRMSRRSVSPVEVVDSAWSKLSRLTQFETSGLLASGLYRLLRGILYSSPESREQTALGRFLFQMDESRWLVQAALTTLLTERSRPTKPFQQPSASTAVGGYGKQYRDLAIQVLKEHEALLSTYVQLLNVAVNDYLLVVALDATKDDHLLSYHSPVHSRSIDPFVDRHEPSAGVEQGAANDGHNGAMHRIRAAADLARENLARSVRGGYSSYRVEYISQVPSNLRSYHVVAETLPGVHIDAMSLVTNADEAAARDVAADLRVLAAKLRQESRQPIIEHRLLELELQGVLGRLFELLRRRRWEADQAGQEMTEDELENSSRLAWDCVSGEGVRDHSGQVSSSLLGRDDVTEQALDAAAKEVEAQELGSDFSLENDPASNRAHVYWRRILARPSVGGHTRIRCTLSLSDASGARPGSVLVYVAVVALTIYITGCFLTRSPWPGGFGGRPPAPLELNADAVVAVLLLVPGFLYTRLDLPARHTITAHLRALSRHVAHISIAAAVLVAAAVASGVSGLALQWLFAVSTTVPLLAAIPLVRRPINQREAGPSVAAPSWLRLVGLRQSIGPPDARYHSSGSGHA